VIDLHSHILPGVDDGPDTLEQSLEIARAAVADGITVMAATPHVREDYPTDPDTMEEGVGQLRRALVAHGVPLDIRKGGEIAFERLQRLDDDSLRRFGLAGNPHVLLLEFPYYGWPLAAEQMLFTLRTRRYIPVLAHPERNGEVQSDPERLRPFVESGALVQVTAASLDGRLGRRPRDAAIDLVERGLAHMIASDAHAPTLRAVGMAAAAEAVGGGEVADWLVHGVPEAIVTGTALPPRPERKRGLFRRR
jgi:protein-tyrosine phosphatase